MKLLGKQILYNFKERHPDAKFHVDSWEAEVEEAQWKTPIDLKHDFQKASILKDNHVVFDVLENRYRLLVQITYKNGVILIKKVGTHKEYDKWKF